MGHHHSKIHDKTALIDDILKQDKVAFQNEIKLLLLGAGESGKSTIFKQMKIIHSHGFSAFERKEYIPIIRTHVIENFRDLMAGAVKLQTISPEDEAQCRAILQQEAADGFTETVVSRIHALWSRGQNENENNSSGNEINGLREAFAKRSQFQLADAASYFLDNIRRIAQNDFMPSDMDILECRVRSTGVHEMIFEQENVRFRIVDVGGQRNERRKWIHCFEEVQAVIFVAAMNEYDQTLFEDDKVNRILEALRLFEEIVNTKFFSDASMILFLNKKDLFEEKIKTVDMKICFPEYTGGCDYEKGIEFLKNKFSSKRQKNSLHHNSSELFIHVTCATSTGNMQFVFDSVREVVIVHNVAAAGLM